MVLQCLVVGDPWDVRVRVVADILTCNHGLRSLLPTQTSTSNPMLDVLHIVLLQCIIISFTRTRQRSPVPFQSATLSRYVVVKWSGVVE